MFRIAIAQFDGATTLRVPPLAAGLLASTIRRASDLSDVGVEVYSTRRPIERAAAALSEAELAGISLYTWNARYSLEAARQAKQRRPDLRVVAGGPSVPRRPEEREQFLAAHPFVDAVVLGEGELAFADIVRAARAGAPLASTVGLGATRLAGDAFARIGSPYLDGTFDELVGKGEIPAPSAVVLETNRGCPFACSYCDWGQATQSRVNELPLERIERELEWIADRKVPYLYLIDANFGIRRRDERITRAIGEVSRARGAPSFVFFHLTKNATAKNLRTVEILREHGVGTQVALSMQDFEPDVLSAIRRENIRPAAALALRQHCHEQGLSTVNELMLGLPAQTADSIRRSVVAAITPFPGDTFFLYPTRVLANTELDEPDYRARHGIETRDVPQWASDPADDLHVVEYEKLVVATASLPVDEWCRAYAFGFLLSALWNQRLLPTTLHVLQYAVGVDVPRYIDALLASERPRLSAIRAELGRFTQAILDAQGLTLPVAGWGDRRREPDDAVCARVFDDCAGFYAEAAEEAAHLVGAERAWLVREAVAWDALHVPSLASLTPTAGVARFRHDWLDYEARMGSSPQPLVRPTIVRAIPPARPADAASPAFALDSWKRARCTVERVAATPLPLVAATREAAALRTRAAEDGFVYVPGMLAEQLAPLCATVEAALAFRGWSLGGRSDPALRLGRWDDPRWLAFFAEIQGSEAYRSLAAAPELLEVMRTLVDGEPRLHVGNACRLVSPGAVDLTTPPHQDAAYLPEADGMWTAWLPLSPCPLALGPLALLAGSHLGGLRTHAPVEVGADPVVGTEIPPDAPWRSLDLEVGDVILFSSLTVHCALPNITPDRLRVSLDLRYRAAR